MINLHELYKNMTAENSVRICSRRTKILDLILSLYHLFTLLQGHVSKSRP